MDNRPDFVIPATPDHAEALAARLAGDHAREVREVARLDPREGLRLSLAASLEAYAALGAPEASPLFMMGVCRPGLLTGTAMLWMLGAEGAGRHPVRILRAARWGIGRAFRITGADSLEQFIPGWYRTGLRFAAGLGFSVRPANANAGSGKDLHRVLLERRDYDARGSNPQCMARLQQRL